MLPCPLSNASGLCLFLTIFFYIDLPPSFTADDLSLLWYRILTCDSLFDTFLLLCPFRITSSSDHEKIRTAVSPFPFLPTSVREASPFPSPLSRSSKSIFDPCLFPSVVNLWPRFDGSTVNIPFPSVFSPSLLDFPLFPFSQSYPNFSDQDHPYASLVVCLSFSPLDPVVILLKKVFLFTYSFFIPTPFSLLPRGVPAYAPPREHSGFLFLLDVPPFPSSRTLELPPLPPS